MVDNKGYMGGLVKYNWISNGAFSDVYICDYLDCLYAFKEFSSEETVKNISDTISKLTEYYGDANLVFPYKIIYKNPCDKHFIGYIMDYIYKYETLFETNTKDMDFKDKIDLLFNIRCLVEKMHNEYKIMHCDLTSKNILYNKDSKDVKIIDFDSYIDLKKNNKEFICSPNVLAIEYANSVGIDKDLDMFMFNIVTFAVLNNVPYFYVLGMIRDNLYGVIENNNVRKIYESYKFLDSKTLKKEYAIDYLR